MMKKYKANKIRLVESIVNHYSNDKDHYFNIEANELPSGKWCCEINIPAMSIAIKAISKTEVGSMLKGADEAYKQIKSFISNNQDFKEISMRQERHWEIECDDNGNFMSMHLNSEYRKKIGLQMQNDMFETISAVEKAVKKIKTINGTDKNLFIQVIDKSFFQEKDSIEDIQQKINDKIFGGETDKNPLKHLISWQIGSISGNCVLAVGYTMEY